MDNPNISVIVPFYNIEDCVDYCVLSLLAQEYQDYELLLVDDGSTDRTSEYLEKYTDNPLVRVIHKSNGGLSDARNVGVREAKGKYITFVDGDDFVSPYYLSSLVNAMDSAQNRIVVGHFLTKPYSERLTFNKTVWKRPGGRNITKHQIINLILYDKIQPSAWAKLAPRAFYEQVQFPLGVRYEEIRTIIKYINQADEFIELSDPIYGYVMRYGSITWSSKASAVQMQEYATAINTICSDARETGLAKESALAYQRALLNVRMHSQLPRNARADYAVCRIDDECIRKVRSLLPDVIRDKETSVVDKLRFALLGLCRPIYDAAFRIYRARKKGVNE